MGLQTFSLQYEIMYSMAKAYGPMFFFFIFSFSIIIEINYL